MFTKEHFNKVLINLNNNLFNHKEIKDLFSYCESLGAIYLLGGAVKDISFFDKKPKDYDIVIVTRQQLIMPNNYSYKLNAFGSPKVYIDDKIFDIWTVKPCDFKSKRFVSLNIDGLFIDLTHESYDAELYNQAIKSKTIKYLNHHASVDHPDKNKMQLRKEKYAKEFGLQIK
jgi:hypothetical protein